MPINLQNLNDIEMLNANSPKFFSDDLTGNGKARGILCESNNPNVITCGPTPQDNMINCTYMKYTNGNSSIKQIPLYIISPRMWFIINSFDKNELNTFANLTKIASADNGNTNVYIHLDLHSIIIEQTKDITNNTTNNTQSSKTRKTNSFCYQLFVFIEKDKNNSVFKIYNTNIENTYENAVCYRYTLSPCVTLKEITDRLALNGYTIDTKAIVNYFDHCSLYDLAVDRSKEWQEEIDKTVEFAAKQYQNIPYQNENDYLNGLAFMMREIEVYNIQLDFYNKIYNIIKQTFPADIADILYKQNLNLLLIKTLTNLSANKALLSVIPANAPTNIISPYYSSEQRQAIESKEPLVIVQAGAGTGKSTVILGRIDYMCKAGIKPEDITVLSFTNAAADNIKEKNPYVHSLTICKMIHLIYSLNFPTHELSTLETLINSLDIYYPSTNTFATQFRTHLAELLKLNRYTKLNNFIEKNYDEVIRMLNTVKQTTLELESIIAYQKIDTLTEPAEVQSKYIIIDEVQDNSIFDFVYLLKYVDKHKESMFLVGDCSQTLYEFRASNPRTLNVLESSGVFATYPLQINYRSNQEILEFANIALQNIEANRFAQIQLRANSLQTVTSTSFQDAVQLYYHQVQKLQDLDIGNLLYKKCYMYIQQKLQAGEQVAFLAYTNHMVSAMEETLHKMCPTAKIVSLSPKKIYNNTIFSTYIKKYWPHLKLSPTQNLTNIIANDILTNLAHLTHNPDKARKSVREYVNSWCNEYETVINQWADMYAKNVMTKQQLLDNIQQNMLTFEIKKNNIKQALLSAENKIRKDETKITDANIIVSTIHSAKGREFDNVVILHKNENNMGEEEKRMYYVAFTRAKKSEFILSYDTVKGSKIKNDYDSIVHFLKEKENMMNMTPGTAPNTTTPTTASA